MVQHQKHSLSTTVSNRDVYWLLHCLESSSHCFSSMRSATAMRRFTSTREPPYKNRWEALEHCPTPCQNEGQAYPHPRTSVRQQRSPCISLCNPPTETRRPIWPHLQRVRAKKTKVMAQDSDVPPVITINGKPLEVVLIFTYLGSTVSSSVNLDSELNIAGLARPRAQWSS